MKKCLLYSTIFFALFLITHQVDAAVLAKPLNNMNLLGYWSFSEDNSATAIDNSGQGNVATFVNMDSTNRVEGKRGRGLSFDGNNEYATIAENSTGWNFGSGNFTVSLWVYPTSFSGYNGMIGTGIIGNEGWTIYTQTDGTVKLSTTGDSSHQAISSTQITLNQWNHIVVVKSGTGSSDLSIYINNTADSSPSDGNVTINSGSADGMVFGRYRVTDSNHYYDGKMDEIRIYGRALSVSEISKLFQASTNQQTYFKKNPTNTGLVGYWSFNEGSGSIATDSSGKSNNGTLTNMEAADWINGRKGKALSFDGADEYVTVPNSTSLQVGGTITIAAWIKSPNTNQLISMINKRLDQNPEYTQYSIAQTGADSFGLGSGKKFSFVMIEHSSNTYRSMYTNNDVADGNWHHVIATADANSQTMKMYIDGVEAATTLDHSSGGWPNTNTSQPLRIANNNASGYFQGQIDDVRIYNRALSATEAKNLYQSGEYVANSSQNNKLTDGLIGLWSFNGADISGTTAYDRSGLNNDGTITNGPTKIQGRVGQALNFDGIDDVVVLQNVAAYRPTYVTVSAWIKKSSVGTQDPVVTYENDSGYLLFAHMNNKGVFYVKAGSWTFVETTTDLVADTWYHLVGTYDGARVRIYLNGVEEASAAETDAIGYNATTPFIGIYSNYSDQKFGGVIDEVRLYNRALSGSEVKQLYLMGR